MGFINRILTPVISVAFFVLVVVTFAQVVFRYLIGYSLYWSEEAARYLFVWISFLGSVMALQKGVHIGFDVCVAKLPPVWKRYTLLFGDLAVLAFLVFISYQGFRDGRAEHDPAVGRPRDPHGSGDVGRADRVCAHGGLHAHPDGAAVPLPVGMQGG